MLEGDGDGSSDGGGRRDLTIKLMEERMQEMKKTITAMMKEIKDLKTENDTLKNNESQNKDSWREEGRWENDPWKNWKGREETTKDGNTNWGSDDGRWEQKVGDE